MCGWVTEWPGVMEKKGDQWSSCSWGQSELYLAPSDLTKEQLTSLNTAEATKRDREENNFGKKGSPGCWQKKQYSARPQLDKNSHMLGSSK